MKLKQNLYIFYDEEEEEEEAVVVVVMTTAGPQRVRLESVPTFEWSPHIFTCLWFVTKCRL